MLPHLFSHQHLHKARAQIQALHKAHHHRLPVLIQTLSRRVLLCVLYHSPLSNQPVHAQDLHTHLTSNPINKRLLFILVRHNTGRLHTIAQHPHPHQG